MAPYLEEAVPSLVGLSHVIDIRNFGRSDLACSHVLLERLDSSQMISERTISSVSASSLPAIASSIGAAAIREAWLSQISEDH